MKRSGILNKEISEVIASMGHYQRVIICDAGFPIPLEVRRIDLTVTQGIPGFFEVYRAILDELVLESVYIAEETPENNPDTYRRMLELLPKGMTPQMIPHERFKELSHTAVACIRTGECKPYSNIMLESGVFY